LERASRLTVQSDVTAAAAAKAAWTAQRRTYIALRHQKRDEFWRNKVDAESRDPRQLWRSGDVLLGRGRAPPCDAVSATEFHRFFDSKAEGVRAQTADALPPTFTPAPQGCSLVKFRPLTDEDIITAVRKLPEKQSANDPIPARLLKDNVDVLAPFLVDLFNRCLLTGSVPAFLRTSRRVSRSPILIRPTESHIGQSLIYRYCRSC